jgi:hypothetical protein
MKLKFVYIVGSYDPSKVPLVPHDRWQVHVGSGKFGYG